MSYLQRSFAKAKLANFPPSSALPELVEEESRQSEEGSDDSSSASSTSSTGTIIPTNSDKLFARPR